MYNILIKQIVFEIIGWGRGVGCVPPLNLPLDTNWWVTYGREGDRQLKQENQLYAKSFTSNYVILNYRANNALINAQFCELPTTTDQDSNGARIGGITEEIELVKFGVHDSQNRIIYGVGCGCQCIFKSHGKKGWNYSLLSHLIAEKLGLNSASATSIAYTVKPPV